MIPYLGCHAARGLLEAFVDAELPIADQVALDGHLRWCDTCRARVDDLRRIGAALRVGGAPAARAADRVALVAIQSQVLARIGVEREQSAAVRLRELCADTRLLWPALGATLALGVCVCGLSVAYGMVRAERSESLAAVISGVAAGRAADAGIPPPPPPPAVPPTTLAPEGEAVFLLSAVVTKEGRVATYELVRSGPEPSAGVIALVDALNDARVAPARATTGAVVNMVWLLARTTVRGAADHPAAKPLSDEPEKPVLRPARS